MRYIFLFIAASLLSSAAAFGQQTDNKELEEQRHAERADRRKARIAEYTHHIDSIVKARSFAFRPNTFQRQPAGSTRQITNPNFELNIYPRWIDVCLPYITGVVPPYNVTILNNDLPASTVDGFIASPNEEGWKIEFSSSLYSINIYKFSLQITSSTGSATLDISTDMYGTVSYWGQITGN